MNTNDSFSSSFQEEDENEKELHELINRYEEMKAKGSYLYLDADELVDIADFYAEQEQVDDAHEVLSYGLTLHPSNTDLLLEKAYLYINEENYAEAHAISSQITDNYSYEVKLLKAEIFLHEDRLEEAIELLNTIKENNDLDVCMEISILYKEMGYQEKAEEWLYRAFSLNNNSEEVLVTMADFHYTNDRFEKAIQVYNILLDTDPYSVIYWNELGKCFLNLKQYEKAIEASEFALTCDNTDGVAHVIKAYGLFLSGDEQAGILEYQSTLNTECDIPEVTYLFLGMAHTLRENWNEALRCLQSGIESIGAKESLLLYDFYTYMAICHSRLDQYEETHRYCEKAVGLSPEETTLFTFKGLIYNTNQKIDKVIDLWEKSFQSG